MNKNTAGSATGINLDRLEQLARAAMNARAFIFSKVAESFRLAASPAAVLELIALARATPLHPDLDKVLKRFYDALPASPNDAPDDSRELWYVYEELRQLARRATPQHSVTEQDELNNGMHDSIFVKVWGDAGGGDAGRRELAKYAYELGKQSTQPLPSAAATQPGEWFDARTLDELLAVADEYLSSRVVSYPLTAGECDCSNALDAVVKARAALAIPASTAVEQQTGALDWPFAVGRPEADCAPPNPAASEQAITREAVLAEIRGARAELDKFKDPATAASEQQAGADERGDFEKAVRSLTHANDESFKRDEDRPDDYADYVMGTYWSIWKRRAALTHRATTAADQQGSDGFAARRHRAKRGTQGEDMIQPTPGRIVWYYPNKYDLSGGPSSRMAVNGTDPLMALVVCVHNERLVNLVVYDAVGDSFPRTYIPLLQGDGQDVPVSADIAHAAWMPYQLGQAKKALVSETAPVLETVSAIDRINTIARVCHEVNRAYCQALGDNSQPAWEDAPTWQRESARMGVDLHLMGDFGPEASHISWMQQKLDEGWKYGAYKDPENKMHPCIVPFAELPREQQAKDFIFRAIVHALR